MSKYDLCHPPPFSTSSPTCPVPPILPTGTPYWFQQRKTFPLHLCRAAAALLDLFDPEPPPEVAQDSPTQGMGLGSGKTTA